MIKLIYTVFIGVLLATFVGVGIAAFYPSPKSPQYPPPPTPVEYAPPTATQTAQLRDQQLAFQKEQDSYQQRFQEYNKNVSIMACVASIILLVISLTILKSVPLMADGVLLGGVLTLIYSILRGFSAGDDKFRFVVVSLGLVIALFLGYLKFVRDSKK